MGGGCTMMSGLLYSQIGYDRNDPMRALIRSTNPHHVKEDVAFVVNRLHGEEAVVRGPVVPWGEKWGSFWWVMDFSGIDVDGEYQLVVHKQGDPWLVSQPFPVGEDLLWKQTIVPVALDQFEERARRTPHGTLGWKDCGANWREVNSHATTVIGMCDLLGMEFHAPLDAENTARLIAQIVRGCDYLGFCQDMAKRLGLPDGAIVHEVPNHMVVIPGDLAQSTVALAKASRLLAERMPDKSDEYLHRAVKAFEHVIHHAAPYGPEGFSHTNHGAPEAFNVPGEWMTRDLLMLIAGGLELCSSGKVFYKDWIIQTAGKVIRRQISSEQREGTFYGHFRTFDSCDFTEKANIHHHVGHDTGTTFPHYLIPLMDICKRWHDHPDAPVWRKAVLDFAYGYFLPACGQNPFYLLPEGYFKGEGLLSFCGPWHGINTSYGFAAALAARLEAFTGDRAFRDIAVGNIQWVAGLNAGLHSGSFSSCVRWREEIEPGVVLPYSQIHGIGQRSVKCWTGIPGTIPNGFSANPQFQLVVKPTQANDGPWLYTDEDWIPHAAGWISALSTLRDIKFFRNAFPTS